MEKERLIIDYINSKDVNIAYLDIIQCFRNSDVLFISDKTKLLAKKRNEIERDKILEGKNTFESGVEIRYIYSQPTEVIIEQNGMNVKYTYSLDWIENNLDESTLWNNFIYLFEYVDFQMRIKLISKVSEIGIFEQLMGVKTKNQYLESLYFIHKQNLSNLQLLSYINVLRKNEVYVENLIEWYFSFYLLNEFNINNYIVKMPSRNTSYLEKCRMITPEIESILKQYSLYVHDGIIDTDLLCISSTPIAISECKSLVDIKNVYCKSDECDNIKYYLFSDQCMLAYAEKNNKSYHSFFNIMKSAKVYITTYPDYLQKDINWLKEHDIIKIMDDGLIMFNDPVIILIFQDLYLNDFINYYSNPSFIRTKIDLLIEKGILEFDNCLFSKFEQDYLNYHLNKQKFDNSLDLRNKYAHSSHSKEQDAEVHKNNYIILMKIMILIIIKINDDIEKREKLNSEI